MAVARRFFETKQDIITKYFQLGKWNLHIVFVDTHYDEVFEREIGKVTFQIIKKDSLCRLAAETHYITFPRIEDKNADKFIYEVSGLDRLGKLADEEEKRLEKLER